MDRALGTSLKGLPVRIQAGGELVDGETDDKGYIDHLIPADVGPLDVFVKPGKRGSEAWLNLKRGTYVLGSTERFRTDSPTILWDGAIRNTKKVEVSISHPAGKNWQAILCVEGLGIKYIDIEEGADSFTAEIDFDALAQPTPYYLFVGPTKEYGISKTLRLFTVEGALWAQGEAEDGSFRAELKPVPTKTFELSRNPENAWLQTEPAIRQDIAIHLKNNGSIFAAVNYLVPPFKPGEEHQTIQVPGFPEFSRLLTSSIRRTFHERHRGDPLQSEAYSGNNGRIDSDELQVPLLLPIRQQALSFDEDRLIFGPRPENSPLSIVRLHWRHLSQPPRATANLYWVEMPEEYSWSRIIKGLFEGTTSEDLKLLEIDLFDFPSLPEVDSFDSHSVGFEQRFD